MESYTELVRDGDGGANANDSSKCREGALIAFILLIADICMYAEGIGSERYTPRIDALLSFYPLAEQLWILTTYHFTKLCRFTISIPGHRESPPLSTSYKISSQNFIIPESHQCTA